jgi:hypothetical protein
MDNAVMKASPFATLGAMLRTFGKGILVAVAINLILLAAGFDPVRALVQINTYDLLGRGRARLAYPSDFQNGQLPLDALLAAHAISGPKGADEFRVALLGESGVAGWGLPDDETLAAQLTAADARTGGRQVVAYNLAYPQPGAARDLLILDAALAYEPDLIVWFVTPATLNNAPDAAGQNRVFFDLNRERLAALAAEYDPLVGPWVDANIPALLPPRPWWYRFSAIRGQDTLPVWINTLFYPFSPPDLAESDRRVGLEAPPDEARYSLEHPGFEEMPNAAWAFLRAGCMDANAKGAGLLVVNEPLAMLGDRAGGGPANSMYTWPLYERYRAALADYAGAHGLWYADLWDAVPNAHFTDTPTHMDAAGAGVLADRLAGVIAGGGESTCDAD